MSREQPTRKSYPADLTDEQGAIVEPLIPAPRSDRGGRPRELDMREVLNTPLSLNRRGCHWEMLPHDLWPKSSVSDSCAQWRADGTWTKMLAVVRERVRREAGGEPTPSAACLESQSGQTPEGGGKEGGYDGGKKIKGRKRHWRVDTLGLLLAVLITSAHLDAGAGAGDLLAQIKPQDFPRLETICGHTNYHNHVLEPWLAQTRPGWRIAVQFRPPGSQGFTPLRKRWGVARTNAWHGRARRNSKDYERKPESAAALIQISNIHLMLRKLAPSAQREFRYDAAA